MYDVPGSGKHHRRPDNGRHVAKTRKPVLTRSDRYWLVGAGAYVILMATLGQIEGAGPFFQVVLTLGATAAVYWRLMHHSGDRHRNGLKTTPQEEEDFKRATGELPVIEPTAISSTPPPLNVAVQPKGRPSWMPWLMFAGAAFIAGMSEVSVHRAEASHRQGDEMDALLGIPGKWNNYQPTIPAMGTRGWGPAPEIPSYSRVDFQKRQQAALMGYEQDRLSGANREKWEQYFQ